MKYCLETNEREEVFVTLSACHDFLQRASNDRSYWKWAFIALHNAVQGAMVVALRRTDGLGPIQGKAEREWLKFYEEGGDPPGIQEKLLSFLELYERIKQPSRIQSREPCVYQPPSNQDWAMRKLNEIRNEFIHFTPKGWYLDLTGAPDTCIAILDIPRFLIERCHDFQMAQHLTTNGYIRHLDGIEDALTTLKLKNA